MVGDMPTANELVLAEAPDSPTIPAGGSTTIDLADVFSFGDGVPAASITYSASVQTGPASVSLSGSVVTISGTGTGQAVVRLGAASPQSVPSSTIIDISVFVVEATNLTDMPTRSGDFSTSPMTPNSVSACGQAIYVFGKVGDVWSIRQYNLGGQFVRTLVNNYQFSARAIRASIGGTSMATDGEYLFTRYIVSLNNGLYSRTINKVTIATGAVNLQHIQVATNDVFRSRGIFLLDGVFWGDVPTTGIILFPQNSVWTGFDLDAQDPDLGCTNGSILWMLRGTDILAYNFQTAVRDPSRDFTYGPGALVAALLGNRIYLPNPGEQRIVQYDIP